VRERAEEERTRPGRGEDCSESPSEDDGDNNIIYGFGLRVKKKKRLEKIVRTVGARTFTNASVN
jgi:hypothetical protein